MPHNEEELHNLASINSTAEDRIYKRIGMGIKMSKYMYLFVAAIVAATVWLTTLEIQVARNDRAIRALWRSMYGMDLP